MASSVRSARMAVENCLRGASLGLQHGPFGEVAVPLDERWKRPPASDDNLEQVPDALRHLPVMAVDEEKVSFVIGLFGLTRPIDLPPVRPRGSAAIVAWGRNLAGRPNDEACRM